MSHNVISSDEEKQIRIILMDLSETYHKTLFKASEALKLQTKKSFYTVKKNIQHETLDNACNSCK